MSLRSTSPLATILLFGAALSLVACEAELPVSKAAASSLTMDPASAASATGPVSVTSLLPGVGDAGDVAPSSADDSAAGLEALLGAWRGSGSFGGTPATAELEVRSSLGRRFVEVRYVLRSESSRYEGFGLLRSVPGASSFQLWWFDNEGGAPEAGAAEATADGRSATLRISRRDGSRERILFEAREDEPGAWTARTFATAPGAAEVAVAELRYERRPTDSPR